MVLALHASDIISGMAECVNLRSKLLGRQARAYPEDPFLHAGAAILSVLHRKVVRARSSTGA